MKNVKNVIAGYLRQYNIEDVHIINLEFNRIEFGGKLEKYLNPTPSMRDAKNDIDKKEVNNAICNNYSKLYLFI